MKRVIFILLIAIFCYSLYPVLADGNDTKSSMASFEKVKELMLENNNDIKKLDNNIRLENIKYFNAVQLYSYISTDGIRFGERFFPFDSYTKMLMKKQKELLPLQAKNSWLRSIDTSNINKNILILKLREKYLEMAESIDKVEIGNSRLELVKRSCEKIWSRFNAGQITYVDYSEAEYQLQKAQNDYDSLAESKCKAVRSINALSGLPLDTAFEKVLVKEQYTRKDIKPIDFYISHALSNRLEMLDLSRDLEIRGKNLDIVNEAIGNGVYRTEVMTEKSDLERYLEIDRVKLEKSRLELIKEIQIAYTDVLQQFDKIDDAKSGLAKQKEVLITSYLKKEKGLIDNDALEGIRLTVREMENNLTYRIFEFNTKLMKLNYAAGIGPAYQ